MDGERMSKRTICIFSSQYLPHRGGVERYTYNLAKHLTQRGDNVVVVTSMLPGLKEYEVIDGIRIFRFPCLELMNGRYPVLKVVNRRFRILHKRLLRIPMDLVLVNTRFYLHSVYGACFAKKKRVKCIMVEHGTGHLAVHNPVGDWMCRTVEHTLTVIDKCYCSDFYGVSGACTEWLEHFHIKAKGVLYNAVDLNEIEEIKKKDLKDFRQLNNIPEEAIIITFTGRLLKEKGILQLTDAVLRLRKEGVPVYLMIAGDGDEEETIRAKADEGICLLGRLNFEDVIVLLMRSDIFCLPSDSEGFSTSVLEAAACKCYIITTERGGAKEMITDSSYGKIIRRNDVGTVTEALREVISETEYRKAAAEKTYHRLKENYTWDIVADKVHQIADGQA